MIKSLKQNFDFEQTPWNGFVNSNFPNAGCKLVIDFFSYEFLIRETKLEFETEFLEEFGNKNM